MLAYLIDDEAAVSWRRCCCCLVHGDDSEPAVHVVQSCPPAYGCIPQHTQCCHALVETTMFCRGTPSYQRHSACRVFISHVHIQARNPRHTSRLG